VLSSGFAPLNLRILIYLIIDYEYESYLRFKAISCHKHCSFVYDLAALVLGVLEINMYLYLLI